MRIKMHILGRIYQMVEQKDMTTHFFFFFLTKTPKSQLTAEQQSTKKCWNLPKKYPTSKDKKKPQQDSGRGTITVISNPIPTKWATHKLENNYITDGEGNGNPLQYSCGWRSLACCNSLGRKESDTTERLN